MNKLSIRFSSDTLTIENIVEHTIQMVAPIISALADPSGRFVFVLLETPAAAITSPNLFCIDAVSGTTLWHQTADKSRSRDNIYTSMYFDTDSSLLVAFDWDGYRSKINILNGEIIESHFMK